MSSHPVFGRMFVSEDEERRHREYVAAELRRLMEHQWNSPRVGNARRSAKWTMPMRLGSDHGYQNDLLGE